MSLVIVLTSLVVWNMYRTSRAGGFVSLSRERWRRVFGAFALIYAAMVVEIATPYEPLVGVTVIMVGVMLAHYSVFTPTYVPPEGGETLLNGEPIGERPKRGVRIAVAAGALLFLGLGAFTVLERKVEREVVITESRAPRDPGNSTRNSYIVVTEDGRSYHSKFGEDLGRARCEIVVGSLWPDRMERCDPVANRPAPR